MTATKLIPTEYLVKGKHIYEVNICDIQYLVDKSLISKFTAVSMVKDRLRTSLAVMNIKVKISDIIINK